MAHYAKMNNNVVQGVVVIGNESTLDENGNESEAVGIQFCKDTYGQDTEWLKTSYNTRHGVHYQEDGVTPSVDQTKSFRKNYAGIGYTYNADIDAFVPPQVYPSWTIDETIGDWVAPVAYPDDGEYYVWDETNQQWVLFSSL